MCIHIKNLGGLINFEDFDFLPCLQNSIKRKSCPEGSIEKMVYTDDNEPIIKVLIDNELSQEQ